MKAPTLFRAFLIDPPWPEKGGGKIKRGADRHYKTMSPKRILETIQKSKMFRPAENAHVYLWVTNNYLEAGLWLLGQLGATYKTIITWPKGRPGLGQYFRGKTEHLLFATIGKGMDPSVYNTNEKSLTTLLENAEHSREHSKKPGVIFSIVERRSHGPYCEMFHDHKVKPRAGWTRFGKPRYSKEEILQHRAERLARVA